MIKSSKSSKSIGQKPLLDAIRAIVIGSVAGALICAVFLGILALVFVSAERIPQGLLTPLVIAVSVLSAFAAGYITVKISKKRGLLLGAAAGIVLFALFLFSGLAVSNKASEPAQSGIRLLVMALSGSIGGILSVSGRRKSKRK
jgi:putative membrane protein (TIGR04086 family)